MGIETALIVGSTLASIGTAAAGAAGAFDGDQTDPDEARRDAARRAQVQRRRRLDGSGREDTILGSVDAGARSSGSVSSSTILGG